MTRHRHSKRDLVALFHTKSGVCHICKQAIQPGQTWDVSHPIPLELGGADDASNWDIAHRKCHRELTATTDQPNIAKAKRREAAHIGARTRPVVKLKSAPFPRSERTAKREPRPSLPPRELYK